MRTFSLAFAASILLAFAMPAPAQTPSEEYDLDIAGQSLVLALKEFSQQTGLQVGYLPASSAEESTPVGPLKGRYTAESALTCLLAPSGLSFQRINTRTIAVIKPDASASPEDQAQELAEPALRLAATRQDDKQETAAGKAETASSADEVVVTGTNIRGVQDIAAPNLTITRQDFEKTGYTGVDQLLEDLPQNFSEVGVDGGFAREGGSSVAFSNAFERASGVNLRGLGVDSTLTLLNGRRQAGAVNGRVFDVSAIPLAAIERVEVVTGGRSAVYGSDAVAGVVNLVTRRDFEGAETQASFSGSRDGAEQLQASQVVGGSYGRGGFIAVYDYLRHRPLDLADTDVLLSPIPSDGRTFSELNVYPDQRRHSVFSAGRFALSERMELFADLLYTSRKNEGYVSHVRYLGALTDSFDFNTFENEHYGVSAGGRIDLGSDWRLVVTGAGSRVDTQGASRQHFDIGALYDFVTAFDNDAELISYFVVFDGALPDIGRITPRAAFGVEGRDESFKRMLNSSPISDAERDVKSAFAEIVLPFADAAGHRVELSLAGRYDDYSDFGDTFNPQVGAIWEPLNGLTLRAAYSSAFRAASLAQLGDSTLAYVELRPDPVSGGNTPVLQVNGDRPGLKPEQADTWSVGLDLQPQFLPSAKFRCLTSASTMKTGWIPRRSMFRRSSCCSYARTVTSV